MKRLTSWLAASFCAALVGSFLTANANAQGGPKNEQANFTLTEPLDVGGTILQPGTYQIAVVRLEGNRNMLRVSNADGTKLLTTVLSIPHPEGPGSVQIPESRYVYYPASAGHIAALRTWFAARTPGLGGHDIVYPEGRAKELAASVNEPVVAIPDQVKEADYATAPLVVVAPDKEVKPYEVVAVQTPPVLEVAPAQPAKVAEKVDQHKRLPRTASNVPLRAGLGLVSLLGALGLGVLGRRLA